MPMDIEHVIVYAFQDTLFPELVECFGLEPAVHFLKIFGGTTIKVPAIEEIRFVMRDYDIYIRMLEAEKDGKLESVQKKLANEYQVHPQVVEAIYDSMKQIQLEGVEGKIRGWSSRNANRPGRKPDAAIPQQ